jgi:hypothetical protein
MHSTTGDLAEARTGSRCATARDPPPYFPEQPSSPAALFSVQSLMLPGLIAYGVLASPLNGEGAIPCLWRLWFGFRCPGCGLSRANALLVEGSVRDALAMNWLILPLWLVAAWSFVTSLLTICGKAHHHG